MFSASLECLPQSYENLRRSQPRHRVQVVSDVDAHRSNRRLVPEPKSHGVGVIPYEVGEADLVVHVASIVESNAAQPLLEWNWEPQLRVEDEQLWSSDRHLDLSTR